MPSEPTIIRTPIQMQAHGHALRAAGKRIGFVPTMGALHAGHLSLIDYVRQECDVVVASIFVNPLQFDRAEDLDTYPRTFEADRALCAQRGTDVIFCPTAPAMYPEGYCTKVSVPGMSGLLCGKVRTGHFDGVTTVVLKLFNAVLPHLAAFGEKDYQQLTLIKRMALDLGLDVAVVGRPTVREADGLAMSSRNVHLSPEERQRALALWRGLQKARALADAGQTEARVLLDAARQEIEAVKPTRLEYIEIVDSTNLESLERLDRPARMAMAVWLGSTRLIDNAPLN